MDSLMKSLSPLDWNVLMSGCYFFPTRSLLWKVLSYIIGLMIISCHLYLMFSSWLLSDSFVKYKKQFFDAWSAFQDSCGIFAVILLWSFRDKFVDMTQALSPYLTQGDHKKLFRLTLLLFVVKMALLFFTRFLILLHWYVSMDNAFQLRNIVLVFIQVHNWDFVSFTLFLLCIQMINMAERNAMTELLTHVRQVKPTTVYEEVRFFMLIKDKTMDCISLLSLMSFFLCFIQTIATICRFQVAHWDDEGVSADKTFARIYIGRLLGNMVQLIYVTFCTSNHCRESRKNLESLESQVIHFTKGHKWLSVQHKIREAKVYAYKVGDFFSVDKNLLLSFACSLVTFTVLFVQLINQTSITDKN